jgi:hypothetical protein
MVMVNHSTKLFSLSKTAKEDIDRNEVSDVLFYVSYERRNDRSYFSINYFFVTLRLSEGFSLLSIFDLEIL